MAEETTEKGLISLKEAAQISGYSSDYVGQLIRAGKIPGKQVYFNVQWMTTSEAVLDYKNKGKVNQKDNVGDKLKTRQRKIAIEMNILKLFFQSFRSALPILVLIVVCLIILGTYILYTLTKPSDIQTIPITEDLQEILRF